MTILFEMLLAIVVLGLLVSLFAMMLTMAFDMSIPEIIEWWEKRRKMKVKDCVPKNMVFHVDTYDDMTEEYAIEELTLEELLDKFTDEGYPNALNALDALEDEDERNR